MAANFDIIRAIIDAKINTNGVQAVTGAKLNGVLKDMLEGAEGEINTFEAGVRTELDSIRPIVINGDVTNAPDEEDLTSANQGGTDVLKFKDRGTLNGMGYIILRRSASFASQLTQTNTIYEIRYLFDLGGATVAVPVNSTLYFNGGTIRNGRVKLASGCRVVSEGPATFDAAGIDLAGTGISIEGADITCSDNAIAATNEDVSGLSVRDCVVRSVENCVKVITDSLDGVVRDIAFEGCTFLFERMGVELQNHANSLYKISGFRIRDSRFMCLSNTDADPEWNTFQSYCYAVSLTGYSENGIISGNTFYAVAIGVEQVGYNGVTIAENTFINSAYPISFSNVRDMHYCNIRGNYINGGTRVRFDHMQQSVIEGNIIQNVGDVYLVNSNDNKISGNRIHAKSASQAIMFDNSARNIAQDNLIFHDNANGQAVVKFYGASATGNILEGNGLWRNSGIGSWWQSLSSAAGNYVYSWINLNTGAKTDALIDAAAGLSLSGSFQKLPGSFVRMSAVVGYDASKTETVLTLRFDNWPGRGNLHICGAVWSGNNQERNGPYKFDLLRCGYDPSNGSGYRLQSDSPDVRFTHYAGTGDDAGNYYVDIAFTGIIGNRGLYLDLNCHAASDVFAKVTARAPIYNAAGAPARSGSTAGRPTGAQLNNQEIGFMYFDTTLGMPVFAAAFDVGADTVTWVDATGAIV